MNRLLLALLLLLAPVLGLRAQPTTTTLSGTVRDAQGQALPGVNVFLRGTFEGTSTDTLGAFHFATPQTGAAVLVLSLLGYQPQELPVALAGQPLQLALKMKGTPHALGSVVVTAGAFEASDEKRSAALNTRDIQTTAGALADVAGALNTLPGTTKVGEEGMLFVRGGAATETKVYLDGLPVQNFYAGSVPAVPARGRFAPTLFRGTVFSTGGYSALYGQALSGVVQLNSTDLAPETQTGLSVSSVFVGASRTKRWERTSLDVSGDYTNLTPYTGLLPQNVSWERAPRGGSGSLKLSHRTGPAGMLKVYGTWSQQQLTIGQPSPEPAGRQTVALRTANGYLNTSFRSPLRGGWSLQTGVALSRDLNNLQPDTLRLRTLEEAVVGRVLLTNDSVGTRWNLKLGAEAVGQRVTQTYQPHLADGLQYTSSFLEKRTAGFVEVDFQLNDRLAGRAGARAEYSALLGRANAAPRLALAYQTTENSSVSAAYGRFYQTPDNRLLLVQPALRFEEASHAVLTYQHTHNGRLLQAEAYHKTYDHLTRFDGHDPRNPAGYDNGGTGYARGLDVLWRDRKTVKNLEYWLSYGLLDTRRQYRQDPVSAVPTFAARHNVSVVGKYWVPKLNTLFGATYSYGSPRRYHNPNQHDGYNQGVLPTYQDLSLNASYLTRLFGQFTIVHVSASNVLGRQNIYGYRYAASPDATGQLNRVAITPTAPRMLFVGVFLSINKKSPGDVNERPE
ncbi:TonB-dependent receptor [Hymenobacter psychrotolerans]|uniref:Outer membrane cobalamin receptor protein n=1 Tax=Hymenobacter psychrotolerans DSM 18569 TaxID=1121959 RepID=A0A1M6Y154_9BACT|nr:TonB-dependent receptor [Hymenobacter psychrotolerans]SHL11853.1 Outer membrane cobalamin receptor protein [Hymenobacter psychrotolerans DSM 18569]